MKSLMKWKCSYLNSTQSMWLDIKTLDCTLNESLNSSKLDLWSMCRKKNAGVSVCEICNTSQFSCEATWKHVRQYYIISFDFGHLMNNTGFPCDQYVTSFYLELLSIQHYFPETRHKKSFIVPLPCQSPSLPLSHGVIWQLTCGLWQVTTPITAGPNGQSASC